MKSDEKFEVERIVVGGIVKVRLWNNEGLLFEKDNRNGGKRFERN